MNVLVRNEYRVEVKLSPKELEEYGITYEDIDYKNIETRRVLWALAEEIRKKSGYNISLSGKILIEVIKENDNGCRFCFSSLSRDGKDDISVKQLIKNEIYPLTAEFGNFEDMLEAICNLDENRECALYEKNGCYRLIFPASENEKEELIFSLCEFSKIFENSSIETARCREMWHLLIPRSAVKTLTGTFLTD